MVACGNGAYLFIDELSTGDHTIHFRTTTGSGLRMNVTYKLNVQ
jgi:hypothetical protein